MRLHVFLLAALLGTSPAMANDPPPAREAAGPEMTKPEETKPKVTSPTRQRLTMEQRFDLANTTRDGHLTLDQAKRGYKTVARNFELIDTTGKGFVTLEDIRAWRKATRLLRQAERAALNDPLRPRQALQRTPSDIPAHEAVEPAAPVGPSAPGSATVAQADADPAVPNPIDQR